MPIYEYRCQSCGEVSEVMQKLNDPAPVCAHCGSKETKRQMSQTSFVLKGTGWYATDYASKKTEKSESAAPASEPASPTPKSSTE